RARRRPTQLVHHTDHDFDARPDARLEGGFLTGAALFCVSCWRMRSPMLQSLVVFSLLMAIKGVSSIFFRHRLDWVGDPPPDRWERLRIVAFLHHTSLYEPIFLAVVPGHVLWRLARHGVIPAASKTTKRPLVGLLYRFVARRVIPISRQRDATWDRVLNEIDPDSM